MIDNLGGVTTQMVRLALDAALLRHQVLANNIANVNTPGYSKKRLSFEEHFAQFLAPNGQLNASDIEQKISALKSNMEQGYAVVSATDEAVELDQEMVEITENVLRYRALLEAQSKRGEILKMAIKEGRN